MDKSVRVRTTIKISYLGLVCIGEDFSVEVGLKSSGTLITLAPLVIPPTLSSLSSTTTSLQQGSPTTSTAARPRRLQILIYHNKAYQLTPGLDLKETLSSREFRILSQTWLTMLMDGNSKSILKVKNLTNSEQRTGELNPMMLAKYH
ncbi:hypothetical protein GJ496_006653 [Pomphorhynchus laevis]|nr:hypothetical protein GJ496_006653 [Pomphorhynchus laevis]